MSLHVLANHMATKGRGPDSMLVHMTPEEVASLQALAMKNGGSLTINPETGLPEAGFLKKLLPAIAGFALNAFVPGLGSAIGGALGTSAAVGTGIAVGGITGLATGSLSKGLMAGLGAYGGAGLADAFMGAGANAIGSQALSTAGYTPELAAGTPLSEAASLSSGAANAASMTDKLSAGFNAVKESPMAFAKDNLKMGLAAASPVIADAMVPTTTKMPTAQSTGYIRPYQYDANTRTVRAMDPVLASEWGTRQFPDFIRKGQTAPQVPPQYQPQVQPQYQPQQPPSFDMARGGIVALADGGTPPVDPNARFNTLSGQSKAAYDYLMGNAASSGSAPQAPARPVVLPPTPAPSAPAPSAPAPSAPAPSAPTTGGGISTLPANPIIVEPAPITPTLPDPDEGLIVDPDDYVTRPDDYIMRPINPEDAISRIEDTVANEQFDQERQDAIDRYEQEVLDQANRDAVTRLEESIGKESLAESARASDIDDATISTDPVYVTDDGTTESVEDTIRQITPVNPTPEDIINQDEFGDLQGAIDNQVYDQDNQDAITRIESAVQDQALAQEDPWGSLDNFIASQRLADSAQATAIDDATRAVDNYETYSGFTPEPADPNIPVETRTPVSVSDDMRSELAAGVDPITGIAVDNGASREAIREIEDAQREEAARIHESMNFNNNDLLPAPYVPETFYEEPTQYYGGEVGGESGGFGGGGSGLNDYVNDNFGGYDDYDNYDYMSGFAHGGAVPRYADGGISGSGNLDLHIPLNFGGEGGVGGGGSIAGSIGGGYPPAGTGGNLNPNTGFGGLANLPKGLAGLLGGEQPRPFFDMPTTPDYGTGSDMNDMFHTMQPRGPQEYVGYEGLSAGTSANNNYFANGGAVPRYALGGLGSLGGYSDGGRLLKGPGDGVSDSIPATIGNKKQPARLADGEFVVPARIVSELGNGSTEAGARKLYAMMDRIQKARGKTVGKGKVAANSRAEKHLPA